MSQRLKNEELDAIYQQMLKIIAPTSFGIRELRIIADSVKTLAWHIDELRKKRPNGESR